MSSFLVYSECYINSLKVIKELTEKSVLNKLQYDKINRND